MKNLTNMSYIQVKSFYTKWVNNYNQLKFKIQFLKNAQKINEKSYVNCRIKYINFVINELTITIQTRKMAKLNSRKSRVASRGEKRYRVG